MNENASTAATTAPAPTNPQSTSENQPIDVDVVSERLDKHIQRLPWAASRMDGSPTAIQAFIVNWVVPIITDMHTMTAYSIDSTESMENDLNLLTQYTQRTLVTAQNTLQGESIALLHLHFERIQSAMMSKLAPTDPASFALAEMHEVFVKLGFAEPFETPAGGAAEAAVPPDDASGAAE